MRLAPLSEVAGPQCAATTVGYVAAVVPLLITPPLGAVGVDRPLAAVLLALKEEDERLKADRTGGGWAEAAGRVDEEEEKEEEEEEKGPNLPVVPPHLAPSALENLDILLYEPFVSGSPVLCLGVASTADTCTCVGTGGIWIISWFLRTGGPRIRGRFSRQSGHYAKPLAGSSLFGV